MMAKRQKLAMKTFLVISFTIILIGVLVQNGYSQGSAKPIKLTFALFQPAKAALSKTNTEFAREIERRTNGRVQIQIFQSISSMYGLAILVIALVGVFVSLILGFLTLVSWEVTGILVTALIGISSLVLTYLSLKQKEDSN